MYRKHPNHTYGRNRNNSANNRTSVSIYNRKIFFKYPPPHPNLGWSDQEGSNPPLLRAPNNTRHKYWIGPKKKYARFISLFSATLKTYISGSPEARAWSPAQLHYGMREQCRVIKNCRCNVCSEIFPNILLNRICILDHKCNVWNEIQAF